MFNADGSLNKEAAMNLAIGLAVVYAVHRFVKVDFVKVAALGVGGVIVAKQVPFVRLALA